jgi:ribosomal protein S18 acetylase RimI-like enzyme
MDTNKIKKHLFENMKEKQNKEIFKFVMTTLKKQSYKYLKEVFFSFIMCDLLKESHGQKIILLFDLNKTIERHLEFIGFYILNTKEDYCDITFIYIMPFFQKKGIFKKLITELKKDKDIKRINIPTEEKHMIEILNKYNFKFNGKPTSPHSERELLFTWAKDV